MTPAIMTPAIMTPAIMTPAIMTPAIMTPAIMTPAIMTPAIMTPAIMTPAIMTPAIISVQALDDYQLLIEYQNNERKIFDVKPYIGKGIFKELITDNDFSTVKIAFDTVEWSNGADIDPETLYHASKTI